MTAADLAVVAGLEPVGLDEIVSSADLQRRFDRKFLVPTRDIDAVTRQLVERHAAVRVLVIGERFEQLCRSCYFDTPTLELYRAHVQDRRRRVKVRTRRYGPTGWPFLELKARDGSGRTVKHRVEHDVPDPAVLGPTATARLEDWLGPGRIVRPGELVPTARVSFQRITLLLDGASPERVTMDRDLTISVGPRLVDLGRHWTIVESKATRPIGDTSRTMHALGYHAESVSKYALAVTSAHPAARGNQWLHVLRRLGRPPSTARCRSGR